VTVALGGDGSDELFMGYRTYQALKLAWMTDRTPIAPAAAWLGHGAWDFAHHRVDKVVPRWYAELCAVLDVMVAIGILLAVPHL
jgi:asparagine synthetase B (glutamine-hydrolysing)